MVLQFLYEHYGRKFHEIPFSIWQLYKTEFDFIEWFTCITDYSFILFILISLISHLVRFNRQSQEQKTLLNALCSDVQNLAEQKQRNNNNNSNKFTGILSAHLQWFQHKARSFGGISVNPFVWSAQKKENKKELEKSRNSFR